MRANPAVLQLVHSRRVPTCRDLVGHEPAGRGLVDRELVDREPVDHEPVDRGLVDHELVDHELVQGVGGFY